MTVFREFSYYSEFIMWISFIRVKHVLFLYVGILPGILFYVFILIIDFQKINFSDIIYRIILPHEVTSSYLAIPFISFFSWSQLLFKVWNHDHSPGALQSLKYGAFLRSMTSLEKIGENRDLVRFEDENDSA